MANSVREHVSNDLPNWVKGATLSTCAFLGGKVFACMVNGGSLESPESTAARFAMSIAGVAVVATGFFSSKSLARVKPVLLGATITALVAGHSNTAAALAAATVGTYIGRMASEFGEEFKECFIGVIGVGTLGAYFCSSYGFSDLAIPPAIAALFWRMD